MVLQAGIQQTVRQVAGFELVKPLSAYWNKLIWDDLRQTDLVKIFGPMVSAKIRSSGFSHNEMIGRLSDLW